MSVFGSLFTAVSGLSAQSDSISMISNNIANVNTVGYKKTDAAFESLVTSQSRSTAYSPGSVISVQNARINQQGILQQTTSSTDIAISGNGFYVVKSSATDPLAEPLYTRAGSFSEDATGVLRNTSGFYLQGWPIDQNGALPAGQANVSSLVPVNVSFLGGLTQPTTQAALGLNLKSSETPASYPVATGFSPDFTRAIKVFDSLGAGHDLTVNFKKMTSPTANITGNQDLANVTGNIAGQVGTITSTDSFTIQVNGNPAVTITTNGSTADLLAQINAVSDPVTFKPLVYAQLDKNGHLSITARNIGDTMTLTNVSGTPLDTGNLGLAGGFVARAQGATDISGYSASDLTANGFSNTDDFTVQIGANAPVTITLTAGMNQLLSDLNAVPGLTAAVDSSGFLTFTSNQDITLADGSGGPLSGGLGMAAAVAATPSTVAGVVYPPTTSPTLLAPLGTGNPPSTEGWWTLEFVTPTGAIANTGAIDFLGNGQLDATLDLNRQVNVALSNIDWSNGSNPQTINFDISGFTQFSGDYNVISSTQNGAELGLRTGVSIDKDGFVIAQFSNGQSSKIFKLPIATFANANGLNELTGNVFRESDSSGSYNLREAGTGSAGSVASGSLEASNVDLAEEFSKMIVTQRAYSANTKVISTADQMTQELLQLR